VHRVDGFARGLARCGDYLFVGTSKIRKQHTFGDLGLAGRREAFCGVTLLHLPTGAFVADLRYQRTCEEIYDVQVLPQLRSPGSARPARRRLPARAVDAGAGVLGPRARVGRLALRGHSAHRLVHAALERWPTGPSLAASMSTRKRSSRRASARCGSRASSRAAPRRA
jgi:hypothetical protein